MSYFLRPALIAFVCLVAACAESPENADLESPRNEPPSSKDGGGAPKKDASSTPDDEEEDDTPPATVKDAGVKRDASAPTTTPPKDAGSTPTAPKDAGGNPLDDLLGGFIDILNPPKDAGTKRDGG